MRFCIAAAFCFFAMASFATAAASSPAALIQHVQKQQWEKADAIAMQLDARSGRGDLMRAYVASARLSRNGQCEKARPLIGAVIKTLPSFVPAYEVLALCLLREGRKHDAHAMFVTLAQKLPEGAWRTRAQNNADALAPSYKPRFSMSGSVTPSTNSNRQTAEDSIGSFTINDESKAKSGMRVGAHAIVSKPLFYRGNLTMLGVLRLGAQYETTQRLLNPIIAFEAPILYQDVARKTSYEFRPFVEHVWSKSHTQSRVYGARGGVQRALNDNNILRLDTSLAWHNHVSDSRDGWRASADLQWIHKFDADRRITLTFGGFHNGSKAEVLRYNQLRISADYEHRLDNGLIPSIAAHALMRAYDGFAPLSSEKQRDYAFGGQIGVSHEKVKLGIVRPELFFGATIQKSNNPFYSHEALDGGIRFKAQF